MWCYVMDLREREIVTRLQQLLLNSPRHQTSDIRQGVDSEEFCLRCQLVSLVRGGWGDVKNVNKYAHLLIVFINNTTAFYHNQS